MALKLFSRSQAPVESVVPRPRRSYRPRPAARTEDFRPALELTMHEDQLQRQLQLERYAYIAANRDLWPRHPDLEKVYRQALLSIDENFSLVPEGFVSLAQTI